MQDRAILVKFWSMAVTDSYGHQPVFPKILFILQMVPDTAIWAGMLICRASGKAFCPFTFKKSLSWDFCWPS